MRFFFLERLKNEPHAYILVVIAKALPENSHTAYIFGCIRHADAETHLAFIGKGKIVDGEVAHFVAVHEGAFPADGEELQQAVLVPAGAPPVRGEDAPLFAEITGAGPAAEKDIVEPEGNIAGPVGGNARGLRGKLQGNLQLRGPLIFLQVIGEPVFHIALHQPEDPGLRPLGGIEIAGIVQLADEEFRGGDAAGGKDAVIRILADGDLRLIDGVRPEAFPQGDDKFVVPQEAGLFLAGPAVIGAEAHQTCFREEPQILGNGCPADAEGLGQVVGAGLLVGQDILEHLHPQGRAEGLAETDGFFRIEKFSHVSPRFPRGLLGRKPLPTDEKTGKSRLCGFCLYRFMLSA